MNLRALEYLVAVADHGTLGKAAAACGVSQPTLSVQLRKLAEELGTDLLDTGGRGASLTKNGHLVLQYARDILVGVDLIRRVADDSRTTVRVGVFPTLAQYLLPHVVGPLRADCDELDIHWTERKSGKLLAMLNAGQLDAAVLATPTVCPAGLHAVELFTERFVLAAPAEHPLSRDAAPLSLDMMDDVPLLLLDDGHCLRDHVLAVCSESGAREDAQVRASSLETLRHMVSAGLGVTLLPHLAVVPPAPPSPGVVLREFVSPVPRRSISCVWRAANPLADQLHRFSDVVSSAACAPLNAVITPQAP